MPWFSPLVRQTTSHVFASHGISNLPFPPSSIPLTPPSKYLYDLSAAKEPTSLSNTDLGILCSANKQSNEVNPRQNYGLRWIHRRECHSLSHAEISKRYAAAGLPAPELKKCKTRGWSEHCECFSRRFRLYHRLRGWMPKGLNYCGKCGKFTWRKRAHKGRCEFSCASVLAGPLLIMALRLSRSAKTTPLWGKFLDISPKERCVWTEIVQEMVQQCRNEQIRRKAGTWEQEEREWEICSEDIGTKESRYERVSRQSCQQLGLHALRRNSGFVYR